MESTGGRRKKIRRRGQPPVWKRRSSAGPNPFRQTSSGFESLVPRDGAEDFFFSQLIADPEVAAEFLEHGGEEREPLLGDPRFGAGVSAALHVLLVVLMFFDPADLLNASTPDPEREIQEDNPLVLFMEEEPPLVIPPSLAPAVPEAQMQPAPAQPAQPEPPPADNRLLIPKAMLPPEQRAEIMNDLPYSAGNTDEFYTEEEVKDPGEEGDPSEEVESDPVLVAESGEDERTVEETEGEDNGNDAVETARAEIDAEDLGDFLFRNSELDPAEEARRREAEKARQIVPPAPRVVRGEGEGGENGVFTDIRRFLAGAQFHNPEGGLVANSDNTLYYNDKGANFVPWIRRMLSEVGRHWRAGMPWAANVYAGHTAVGFTVSRDGTVIDYQTLVPSNVAGFDNIAVGAIRAADLLPLPADYPDDTFDIIIVFWVNERPYDIFR